MKITKGMYSQMTKQNGGGFYWEENGTIQILSHKDWKFYTSKGALSKRHIEAVLTLEDGMMLKGKVHRHHEIEKSDMLEFKGEFKKFAPVLYEIKAFCEIIDNKYAVVHLNEAQKKSLEELKCLAKNKFH